MDKPKWTPGPWRVKRTEREPVRQEIFAGNELIALAFGEGNVLRAKDLDSYFEKRQANSRLIAAAPEMAELLEAMLCHSVPTREHADKARTLLTRIKG